MLSDDEGGESIIDSYNHVFNMLQGHLEAVDIKSVEVLENNSEEYKGIIEQLDEIYRLPWFDDFLNQKINSPMSIDKIKTIHQFMNLQSIANYDLKVMYYLCGMQDATRFNELYKQLND